MCIDACPYGAIDFDEEERVAVVNGIMCQGCGACSAVCPGGVSQQSDFTTKQMLSMIDAGLDGEGGGGR
jgi:heterodisulfide reductase subunit A